MGLDDLQEVIEKLQGIIKTRHDYLLGKERRTRQVLIDPLLGALGWDVSDPGAVYIEHNWMDYALMSNASPDAVPVAVIEAKPLGEPLEKKAITQAIAYAIENNIPCIIVTNGDRWEMYEVLKPGTMEDKKLMEFQLSEHLPQECGLQASRIWKSNLAPSDSKEAMEPVPPDKTAKATPVLPDPAPKPEKGKKTMYRLVVTMHDGTKMADSDASNTFVDVIKWLGIPKVEKLRKTCNHFPLISTSKHPPHTQREVDGYYIMTSSKTKRKKTLLEEIAIDLGVKLKVEMVPKG